MTIKWIPAFAGIPAKAGIYIYRSDVVKGNLKIFYYSFDSDFLERYQSYFHHN